MDRHTGRQNNKHYTDALKLVHCTLHALNVYIYKMSIKRWIIATFCIILLSWECMVKYFLTELQAYITITVFQKYHLTVSEKHFRCGERKYNVSTDLWPFVLNMVFFFPTKLINVWFTLKSAPHKSKKRENTVWHAPKKRKIPACFQSL